MACESRAENFACSFCHAVRTRQLPLIKNQPTGPRTALSIKISLPISFCASSRSDILIKNMATFSGRDLFCTAVQATSSPPPQLPRPLTHRPLMLPALTHPRPPQLPAV